MVVGRQDPAKYIDDAKCLESLTKFPQFLVLQDMVKNPSSK